MTVFIEIPESERKKIDTYAKKQNLSLQALFLDSVLKRIDAEEEVGSFASLLTQYTEDETEYSFDELGIEDSDKK